VRAAILGMLMPASSDAKKDREVASIATNP